MKQILPILSSVLAWLLAAFFLFGAYGNIFISDENAAAYAAWGYPGWFHYITAVLELTSALLLVISKSSRPYGAALGAMVMAAASVTTLVNGDYAHSIPPMIVLLVSLVVLGLSLLTRRITN